MEHNTEKLSEIIQSAVNDYIEKSTILDADTWLEKYLAEQLPSKTSDEIKHITVTIINTINIHEKAKAEMNEAISKGISAENWFAQSIEKESGSNSEKAKKAVKYYSSLAEAENTFQSQQNQNEVIDIEVIPPEEWDDGNWNPYRLKDALRGTAEEAGRAALVEISDNIYSEMAERSAVDVLTDKETIVDSLVSGADVGLKKAAAGALTIASDIGVIPESSVESLTTIAHRSIENLKVFGDVLKGKKTLTEAIITIKDNAVAAIKGIFSSKDTADGEKIVGESFGSKAAKIGASIVGILGKKITAEGIKGVVKKIASVALTAVNPVLATAGKVIMRVGSFIKKLLPF